MTDTIVHALGIPFATVTGAAAGVLAVLSWQLFRESPFGRAVALLSVVASVITFYHVLLLALGSETFVLQALRSGVNTVIAGVLLLVVHEHRRLRRDRTADR
ncbi:hypothetical protein SAMN05216559_1926 [Halomicrobium zhouii]|uniref:Uncharacterized protein n=1 Tax=Halomicrobium zhouii TaxID=767519 RepID=A0A1I6L304_9EURY|nr:hypothetical protein [Halomicrobium zhouii]SFR97849.1 hypothetical protein SAMN05216559_1926 [Halomicrobium zhouii]